MAQSLKLSDWNRVKGIYGVGRVVEAVVARQVGLGALVRVGSEKTPGVVRNREMSWKTEEQRNDLFAEGASFRAVVIGHDAERRELILSRKGAATDPVVHFHAKHPNGKDVVGQVQRIVPGSGDVFVTLEGGIEGYLPAHTLPVVKPSSDLKQPWAVKVGDWVRARKLDVDLEKRRIRLDADASFKTAEAVLAQRVAAVKVGKATSLAALRHDRVPQGRASASLRVLFADDNPDIREAIVSALKTRGHRVHSAETRAEAHALIGSLPALDVAVVDLQLGNYENGTSLLGDLRKRHSTARVVLTSGNTEYARFAAAATFVRKPFDAATIVRVVEGITVGPSPSAVADESIVAAVVKPAEEALSAPARAMIDGHLVRIQTLLPRARAVALLTRNDQEDTIQCVRVLGPAALPFMTHSRLLVKSSVEDVLDEDEGDKKPSPIYYVRRLGGDGRSLDSKPFDDFLDRCGARAVVGFPVPAEAAPQKLGVFAFLALADPPDGDLEERLYLRAEALGVALDRAFMNAQMLRSQRADCAGGISLVLAHELANGIGGIINRLDQAMERLDGNQPKEKLRPCLERAQFRASDLMKTYREVLDMVQSREGTQREQLDEVVKRVLESLRSTAEHHNVRLAPPEFASPKAAGLLVPNTFEQAVLNLVLNSVQHTGAFRNANHLEPGLVETVIEVDADDPKSAVLRVHDTGPGIDGAAFGRVFDMYHTTRTQGTGLGLHVTRMIVESCGGTVAVEQSIKFIETTFAVRLPLS
jgi:signal transduction histidine kinase/ActR/RegA family two-component response regulator